MGIIEAVEILFLEIINQVYGAIGWPGVIFLMAIESAAIRWVTLGEMEKLAFPRANRTILEDLKRSYSK